MNEIFFYEYMSLSAAYIGNDTPGNIDLLLKVEKKFFKKN